MRPITEHAPDDTGTPSHPYMKERMRFSPEKNGVKKKATDRNIVRLADRSSAEVYRNTRGEIILITDADPRKKERVPHPAISRPRRAIVRFFAEATVPVNK